MIINYQEKYPEIYDFKHGILNPFNQRMGNAKIFNRVYVIFEYCYGPTWTKKFSTEELHYKTSAAWMGVLTSMTYSQIKRAILKIQSGETDHNKYPPQILEFKQMGIDKYTDKITFFCCHESCMRIVDRCDNIIVKKEAYYCCTDHVNMVKDNLIFKGKIIENKQ